VTPTDDLNALYDERAGIYGAAHTAIDELVGLYEGKLPPEFNDYFAPEMHIHIINMVRLAWDDLATMAGKEFPIYVRPDNQTQTAKDRAERLEQVGYGYNENGRACGGITMKLLQKVNAWWMVGGGSVVNMVLPSFEQKRPFFTFRDPRTYYPPGGWSPFSQAAAEDALFVYPITLGELKRRYPEKAQELDQKVARFSTSMSNGSTSKAFRGDDFVLSLGEYYHADSWIVQTLTEIAVTVARSDDGDPGHPGLVPVSAYGFYSALSSKARGLFADQVSIQAATARMFSQQLDFYDRMLYPLIFHTPLVNEKLRLGPNAANTYDTSSGIPPRVDTVQPAHSIDANAMMSFALGLSRVLNRNPEQMQGQGEADSAKALTELKSGITSTIRDWIWPPMVEAQPKMYELAARLEVKLWPNERRTTVGSRRNQPFSADYVPAAHLAGRESSFRIEPGLGLAGYQGTLELMQLVQSEMIPEDEAMEQGEWVRNVQEAKRGISLDRLSKVNFAMLTAKAEQGALAPDAISLLRKAISEGATLDDALMRLAAEGKLEPPPPPPVAPGMPGAPGAGGGGLPPELAAMAPQLSMIQGGRR
jgi:hypothetical protein